MIIIHLINRIISPILSNLFNLSISTNIYPNIINNLKYIFLHLKRINLTFIVAK